MLIKIVAVQARMGQRLNLEERIHIFKQRPDFVCLPEYWLFDDTATDFHRAALAAPDQLKYLSGLSDELSTCLIAGTVVEAVDNRLYNTAHILNRGDWLGSYRKRHPVPGELKKGISPGTHATVIDSEGVRLAILICGDVFVPERYEELRDLNVDVVFVPTTSAFRPDDSLSQKNRRDERYFLDGAKSACAYVVKVCGVGSIFGHPLQGRSLICAPWSILKQVEARSEQGKQLITITLDIEEVRDFRRKNRKKQGRAVGKTVGDSFSSVTD
jgi:predicted amidohydrolase